MGREVMRVPLNFKEPLNEMWRGYNNPHSPGEKCPDCDNGWSIYGKYLFDLWYGHVPFNPIDTNSKPFTVDNPVIVGRCKRNGDRPRRLVDLFNNRWQHHLDQDDVNALIAVDRLSSLTHKWDEEKKDCILDESIVGRLRWLISGPSRVWVTIVLMRIFVSEPKQNDWAGI